jgi:peptidoglycan/xylan/chitin deacetylase (PgdA/CDA1 family)
VSEREPDPDAAWRARAEARRRRAELRRRRRRRRRTLAAGAIGAGVLALVLVLALSGSTPRARTRAQTPAGSPPAGTGAAPAPLPQAAYVSSPEMRRLIAFGRPIYCAPRRGDEVALTFDDGPGPYTRLMLAKLHKHHVHATFFVVGRNIGLVPGAVSAEHAIGAVGDHTFTHPLLTALAPGEAEQQIVRTQQALEAASGGAIALFRPPYGGHDATVDRIAREHGLLEILWSVDSADSLGANYLQIERNVISGLHPGAIILMHENHGQTVRAMLAIFAALERRHLRPVSVPQLLSDDPPSTAQLDAGGAACGPGTAGRGNGG